MSWRITAAASACVFIVACGGNPFNNAPTTGGGGTTPPVTPGTSGIPAALKGSLQSATYNKAAGTLSVAITPLGGSTSTPASPIVFTRNNAYDTNGFQAFTYQESTTGRLIVALFDTSALGAGSAGVAGSGQFTQTVWGSTYGANQAFTRPAGGGVATYSGRYAGILNTGTPVAGPGAPFDPSRAARTRGDVVLNADFTNNAVEGGIRNRTNVDAGTPLADVFLKIGTVNPDGTFGGAVAFGGNVAAGTYGGTFAGTNASSAVGAVEIAPVQGNSDLLERGVFVADRCAPTDPSPCP